MTTFDHESRYSGVKDVRVSFRVPLFVPLCACLALLSSLAVEPRVHAAGGGQQVSISLSVLDDQSQPVSDAKIELRLDERLVATAVTDAAGKVTIELPLAGSYVLVVSKKGYISTPSPLAVKADNGSEQVEVTLPQNALSRQIANVQAASPEAATEQAASQATLPTDQVKDTPSRPATLIDALPLVPGVVRDINGTLDIAGYGENHSTLLVNSVDVSDPATGAFGLSVPIDSVETISVSEMPYLAQYGKFIAGVVTAETRRGGDKWNFSLNDPLPEFRIRSGSLVGLKTASPRVNFSGPLIANNLFVSEGGEFLLYKQPVRTLPFPFNETKSTAINSFTQIVIRGGIGIFYDSVPLGTYAFGRYPEQIVTTYNSSGAVIGSPVHYLNVTEQRMHSQFPLVDRARFSGNFAPYGWAWNIEAERPLNRFLTLRAKYLQSWAQDLITLQPGVVQNQSALILGSSGSAQTRQFEITARIGAELRRQFFFSYVRQHARGDISTANPYVGDFPFPVVRQNLRGSLPSEIPNRFLLWGIYALPWKMQAGPQVEYRNGFPYQPTNVFQQYVELRPGPQYRFPKYFSLDLRVSKDFQVSKKYAVRFSATLLNLTNHFNALDVHSNIADPQYGRFFGNYQRHFLIDFDVLY